HLRDAFPGNPVWATLALWQSHVEWRGCTLHDLIQPSFSFLVGVALPFSLAARENEGQSPARQWGHALIRSAALILLGVFLRSVGHPQTRWTFEDTLTQIGLGYPLLFALARRPAREAPWAIGSVLVAVWLWFVLRPLSLPGPDQGVEPGWPHLMQGFAAHWNKNANPAFDFDVWFLNLLPRESVFRYNGGGYSTLSFLPTLATMALGLVAGRWMRAIPERRGLLRMLAVAAVAGITLGIVLDVTGICPAVKRIWTPGWVVFSGGWCAALLAGFVAWCDPPGTGRGTDWLRTIGANSIAAYVGSHWFADLVRGALRTHLGPEVLGIFGEAYVPTVTGACMLVVFFAVLHWMRRRRLFLKL
ncbi:MAG: DUF5009 domain-containing protein, partial [Armatimonadota bacterium]